VRRRRPGSCRDGNDQKTKNREKRKKIKIEWIRDIAVEENQTAADGRKILRMRCRQQDTKQPDADISGSTELNAVTSCFKAYINQTDRIRSEWLLGCVVDTSTSRWQCYEGSRRVKYVGTDRRGSWVRVEQYDARRAALWRAVDATLDWLNSYTWNSSHRHSALFLMSSPRRITRNFYRRLFYSTSCHIARLTVDIVHRMARFLKRKRRIWI